MFQTASDQTKTRELETQISPKVKLSGSFVSAGDVVFNGSFDQGELDIKGKLEVGNDANIMANVKATNLIVHGKIEGNVVATENIEIGESGSIVGDISAGGNFVIMSGGVFIGKSIMGEKINETEKKVVAKAKK